MTDPNLRFLAVFCENLRFSARICVLGSVCHLSSVRLSTSCSNEGAEIRVDTEDKRIKCQIQKRARERAYAQVGLGFVLGPVVVMVLPWAGRHSITWWEFRPRKKNSPRPPKFPNLLQTPSLPLGPSRPGEPPPLLGFSIKNRSPTPPSASTSPKPRPTEVPETPFNAAFRANLVSKRPPDCSLERVGPQFCRSKGLFPPNPMK